MHDEYNNVQSTIMVIMFVYMCLSVSAALNLRTHSDVAYVDDDDDEILAH